MKKNITATLLQKLKSNALLAVAGSMVMVSCSVQMGGYSETDGVYYDPSRDTLPQGTYAGTGNAVGDYYDYQNTYSDPADRFVRDSRYRDWDNTKKFGTDSDWGTYAGTDVNYNSWGSPYYGFGYGFGPSFGWNSYFGLGFGMNYYSPFYSMYDPFWGSFGYGYPFYSSYYGYSPYYYGGYYNYPYYGYGYNSVPYRRSEPTRGFRTNDTTFNRASTPQGGFRTYSSQNARTQPANPSSQNDGRRVFRNQQYPSQQPQMRQRTYEERPVFRQNDSYNRGGNDGFRSGGFNNGSSGSFGGGAGRSSGGGFRTGGR